MGFNVIYLLGLGVVAGDGEGDLFGHSLMQAVEDLFFGEESVLLQILNELHARIFGSLIMY